MFIIREDRKFFLSLKMTSGNSPQQWPSADFEKSPARRCLCLRFLNTNCDDKKCLPGKNIPAKTYIQHEM